MTKFLLLFAADLHKRETRKAGGGERVQGGRGTSTNLPVGYNSCLWCCLAIRQISRIRWQSIQFVANSIFDLLQSKMWPQAACSRQQQLPSSLPFMNYGRLWPWPGNAAQLSRISYCCQLAALPSFYTRYSWRRRIVLRDCKSKFYKIWWMYVYAIELHLRIWPRPS